MLEIEAYLKLRNRPQGPHIMYQRWRSLVFLHFACPAAEIQEKLPSGLTVDTFPDADGNEMAWIGLVPFRMEGVRPRGLPGLPRLSAFPETNVRTYVHREGKSPGVWFFSLEAAQPLACQFARKFFALPYHEAEMSVMDQGDEWEFESRRLKGDATCTLTARPHGPTLEATPGTLEFFLLERYLLYAYRQGQIYTGLVSHRPYQFRETEVVRVNETLVKAAGIQERPFIHSLSAAAVDVEIFPLRADHGV
ncbi:DUF2071 domain-containing protein [soil metagenome]